MSFRKRSVVVSQPGIIAAVSKDEKVAVPGVRPSPLDGRATISTGTRSLDGLLAGHAGLALGTSLLIEESGTTDFGGVLLRYYAAEGVVQGHHIHCLGVSEAWARELPGVAAAGGKSSRSEEKKPVDDKMKIAWRYERLGEFGVGAARERGAPHTSNSSGSATPIFCHDFDLSKRLTLPSTAQLHFTATQTGSILDSSDDPTNSPFTKFISQLSTILSSSPNYIHRVIIPTILSPALYPCNSSQPAILLQFLHGLRALLRKYPSQLTAMITLPLTLHPRNTGLTRWMELLSDGVLELAPFPSTAISAKTAPGASAMHEEPPQGMLQVHRLPIFHEKGGGGGEASGFGDDLAFALSRRKGLVIKPFSLPPVEGDAEAQGGRPDSASAKATKFDIEY
ncbi:Elongator complex protein 4 [Calycina marina]|uniref:Elongator complex protein 4 n=1 Tax=Calycina marina TaxID=1763456 RepID=A0A9P7Z6F7_9HELO|nr:Elongator complex protein 4 [Calycina marina]